ncbi:MAG TPA: YciI family protein [Pyrinomonadaceae bacterium]|nr:YciI family protein [Pyrinomonadaceae bacterium]
MKYLLMIYHDEGAFNSLTESDKQQMYGEYRALRERLIARGQYIDGSQLQPTGTATSIRLRDGKELVTDGPFAETHEQLGGYFLINVDTAAEAVAIAKQIPSARTGTVEVRALIERAAEANA